MGGGSKGSLGCTVRISQVTRGFVMRSGPAVPNMATPISGSPKPPSGFRTAGQATSGGAVAGFPGLERKFRRGRWRGKSVSVPEKEENRPGGLGSRRE